MVPIKGQLSEILEVYHAHEEKIRSLVKQGYKEEAVILTVTIFEVFFRDLFRITHELWFPQHLGGSIDCLPIVQNIAAKKEIRDYLEKIKAYSDFLGNYYVFQVQGYEATKLSIYYTLFDEKEKMYYLNFQNLSEDNGVRKTYKIFFNVDLMLLLDTDENKSLEKWAELSKLFKERHAIVHKGKVTDFSEQDILELLDSLDYLKNQVLNKILTPFSGSIT